MIIEQAFVALPELLLGNHYAVQEYEAGIVGVLSMAILQELNGRNVSHPIQHLQAERRYDPALPRRVDLYLNIRRLMLANRRLGNYGWRHHNRYFLHVYDDEPEYYLAYRNQPWGKALHQAGRQNIVVDQLAAQPPTAKNVFGEGLDQLQLQATVTNLVNYPVAATGDGTHYWCVLTRFAAFSVSLGESSFQVHLNRVTWENHPRAYVAVANAVSEQLGVRKPSEA